MPLPLHPAIAHVPLGLAFAVPLVAIGIAVAFWRGRLPRNAFAILAGMQILLVASGFAAMVAGHRDEHRVERVVGERVIETHEERAEAFVWTAVGVAALGLALLFVPARAVGGVSAVTVAGTIAVAALAAFAGEAGGQIVYHHGGAAVYAAPGGPAPAAPSRGDGDEDDDD
jgi:uncharacterized membrane protein